MSFPITWQTLYSGDISSSGEEAGKEEATVDDSTVGDVGDVFKHFEDKVKTYYNNISIPTAGIATATGESGHQNTGTTADCPRMFERHFGHIEHYTILSNKFPQRLLHPDITWIRRFSMGQHLHAIVPRCRIIFEFWTPDMDWRRLEEKLLWQNHIKEKIEAECNKILGFDRVVREGKYWDVKAHIQEANSWQGGTYLFGHLQICPTITEGIFHEEMQDSLCGSWFC